MKSKFQQIPFASILSLLMLIVPYFLVNAEFLLSNRIPPHDSATFHFPAFQAIADSFKQDHTFPQCFWISGGTRVGLSHVSCFHFIPHRIIGYLLYCLLPVSMVFMYKLQLLLGMTLTAVSWWLVLKRAFNSPLIAYFGAQMILMGGTGISLHQEQVISTMHLIPWLILALQNLKQDHTQILACAALCGISLSTHQPQIQLITVSCILVGFLFYNSAWKELPQIFTKKRVAVSVILIALGILPSIYLYQQKDILATALRLKGELSAGTFNEYAALNRQQMSSAFPFYFSQYLAPVFSSAGVSADRCAFFVGRLGIVLAVVGVAAGFSRAWPAVVSLIIFSLLTLGFNSPVPIPKILYAVHFPFINFFRQWIHFFPMVNLSLSVLACLGLEKMVQWSRNFTPVRIVLFAILLLQLTELSLYCRRYLQEFSTEAPTAKMETQLFAKDNFGPARLFVYKSRQIFQATYPNAVFEEPILDRMTPDGKTIFMRKAGMGTVQNQRYELDVETSEQSLLVAPLNFDLNFRARIDGTETKIVKVYSSFCGLIVPPGSHKIVFAPSPDPYPWIVLLQTLLYAWSLSVILHSAFKGGVKSE